jgi:hypothetical protein
MVWKKGQSGNPKGRKRRINSITDRMRHWSEKPFEEVLAAQKRVEKGDFKGLRWLDIYCLKRMSRGLKDEYTAKNINDRLEGKPVTPVGNPDGSNLLDGLTADHAAEIAKAFMTAHKAAKKDEPE